jgi:predicted Fe-Mo cluster-binding NifX family protein
MRTAISVTTDQIDTALLDTHFSRCTYFAILESNGKIDFLPNPFINLESGAGLKTAAFLHKLKVNQVIGYQFGLKIKQEFDRFQIQMIALPSDRKPLNEIMRLMLKSN